MIEEKKPTNSPAAEQEKTERTLSAFDRQILEEASREEIKKELLTYEQEISHLEKRANGYSGLVNLLNNDGRNTGLVVAGIIGLAGMLALGESLSKAGIPNIFVILIIAALGIPIGLTILFGFFLVNYLPERITTINEEIERKKLITKKLLEK